MNEQLKLIEGMKRLKVVEKKLLRNIEMIQQYSSAVSTEKSPFGTDDAQKAKVKELVQANTDLVTEYLHLKSRVDMTNLTTMVTMGKREYRISDLLVLRRSLAKLYEKTFAAMNTFYGDQNLGRQTRNVSLQGGEKPPHVVRFYNEQDKFDALADWQGVQDEIEQRLEVINATTNLVTI